MPVELESSILKPSKERVDSYGKRPDGSAKGTGFFGEIPHPTKPGVFSTELTIGVHLDGKPQNIPLIVPTLNRQELDAVMMGKEDDRIVRKAVDHAKQRLNQGRSPYAEPNEVYPLPKE
jgi:hypothetical protein